jgi:hypothetical protein
MFFLAAFFYVCAVSGFSLAFIACNGTFPLDAALLRCHRPIIFLWLFWLCVVKQMKVMIRSGQCVLSQSNANARRRVGGLRRIRGDIPFQL